MNMNINMILSIGGAALGLIGLVSALYAIRMNGIWRARCLAIESSLAAVHRELELVASISMKAGRRVKRMEQEYSGVVERVDQVELRGGTQSFDQAIDSARHGSNPDALAQQFGLSRGEADLVMRLHGVKKSA